MNETNWVEIATKFGLPTGLLIVALMMLRQMVVWTGTHVLIPLRDRIIKYMDDVTEWNRGLSDKLDKQMAEQATHHAWEEQEVEGTGKVMAKILSTMERFDEGLNAIKIHYLNELTHTTRQQRRQQHPEQPPRPGPQV